MIELQVKDGYYIIKGPKCTLVLTRAQFIEALKCGKPGADRRRWLRGICHVAKHQKTLNLLEVARDGFEYPDRPISPLQRRILRDDTPRDRSVLIGEHCKY
jgi:hypothetical protein